MSRPWMPLYVSDYLGDTQHFSTIEHGAYMLLIMHYWQAGSLPADETRLARIARMTPDEWAASRDVLSEKFDTGWRHGRIDEELAKSAEISAKRKTSIEKRWKNKCATNEHTNVKQENASCTSYAREKPQPQNSEANASAPAAAKQYPLDPVERLWAEGIDLMGLMGCQAPKARPNIGRWLRDARNDAGRVLDAIRRAHEMGTKDPLALVSRILNPINREKPNEPSLSAHARNLTERIAASQRGEPMFAIGGEPGGGDPVRMLPDGRSGRA